MKNYKGLYHDNDIKAPNYEHGAHFKYSDLVEALKKLQVDLSKDKHNLEINNYPTKDDKILINVSPKKHKKFKLKDIKNNENHRYNEINYTERNDKEIKEGNIDIFIKYSKDTDKDLFKRKRNHKHLKLPKELCKSLDRNKSKLPTINSNLNSISLRKNHHKFNETEKVLILDKNNENFDESEKVLIFDKNNKESEEKEKDKNKKNEDNSNNNNILNEITNRKKNKSKTNRKHYESEIFLPKIKYNYYNQMTINKEDKDKDLDNEIFENKEKNNDNINTIIISPIKKHSHGMLTNILSTERKANKEDLLQDSENKNLNYKLKSIFETERKIKHHNRHNNHHFSLNSRNKIFHMKHMETTNNELSKQIYNLKKNLLSNNFRNPNILE
jgi:hypothetical protein